MQRRSSHLPQALPQQRSRERLAELRPGHGERARALASRLQVDQRAVAPFHVRQDAVLAEAELPPGGLCEQSHTRTAGRAVLVVDARASQLAVSVANERDATLDAEHGPQVHIHRGLERGRARRIPAVEHQPEPSRAVAGVLAPCQPEEAAKWVVAGGERERGGAEQGGSAARDRRASSAHQCMFMCVMPKLISSSMFSMLRCGCEESHGANTIAAGSTVSVNDQKSLNPPGSE